MKIKADWGHVRALIAVAAIFAVWCAALGANPINQNRFGTGWDSFFWFAGFFLVIFLWPMISDFAKALWRALSISKAPSSLARSSEISGPRLLSSKRARGLPRP